MWKQVLRPFASKQIFLQIQFGVTSIESPVPYARGNSKEETSFLKEAINCVGQTIKYI